MSAWGVPTPPVGQIREPMLDSRLEWICAAIRKNATAEFEHYEALLDHLADIQARMSENAILDHQRNLNVLAQIEDTRACVNSALDWTQQGFSRAALDRVTRQAAVFDRLDWIERELFPLLCRSLWRSVRRLWRRVWPSR